MTYQKTSLEAFIKVQPHIGSINGEVYSYIVNCGINGATDQEIEAVIHIEGNSVRPSRGALVKKGWISNSGKTRKNSKGNNCIVWVALEEGMML